MHSIPGRRVILSLFLIFLLLPIYWLVNMSFKTNEEIVSTMTLWPHQPTIANYMRIFTDESWYSGYINSLKYVVINTVISISVALPAAYAFSRYRFLGDKHLFFWLLSNRMAPAAVYALPFFNLYSAIDLFDTPWAVALAHCIFNVPLAVWILEGFVSGVPREIDETAFLDGYSFPRFFIKILVPLIASGIGVAAFFCFMFSWVELLLARTLTSVNAKPIAAVMTRTVSAAGMDWGLLAAAGVLTIIPGALVIWFVRNYIARGFALGGCMMIHSNETICFTSPARGRSARSAGCGVATCRDRLTPTLPWAGRGGGPFGRRASHGKHRMDGLDAADRDFLRAARRDARGHDLACHRLSGSRARRDPADSDHARRSAVHFADHGRRHPSVVDRLCRHRHRSRRFRSGKELNCRACGSPP